MSPIYPLILANILAFLLTILTYSAGERRLMHHVKSLETQMRNLCMSLKDEFANLTAKVAANTTVEQSAVTLIQGLKAQLDALANQDTIDPADVKALADKLGTDDDSLAAAVTANTPAAPAQSQDGA